MKHHLLLWLIACTATVLTSCTNATSDESIPIEPAPDVDPRKLVSAAENYLDGQHYICAKEENEVLNCKTGHDEGKTHSVREEIDLFRDPDNEKIFLLQATRWDEGLMGGDAVPEKYINCHMEGVCAHIEALGLGTCWPNKPTPKIKKLDRRSD